MAFEPIYDTAQFDGFVRLATGQAVVEARLLPKPQTKIAKVLSTCGYADVSAAESFTGEARYAGRVNFKVLFETADGNVDVLDYNADFSDKIENKAIGAQSTTKFKANILDMDIIAAEEDVVKLAAVVEVELYVLERENVRYVSGAGESVCLHEDRVPVCTRVSEINETFIVTDTVTELKDCQVPGAEAEVITLSNECGEDTVTIEGEVCVNLILKDKSGLIAGKRIFIPVSRQCRAASAKAGDAVTGGLSVKNVSVITHDEENGERTAEIEIALQADCVVTREQEITPAVDAFSTEHQLLQTVQSVDLNIPKGDITKQDRIDGNVELEEKLPLADNILGVFGCRVGVSNTRASDGKIAVEGMLGANIVYYNAEQASSNTVFAQIPFSTELDCSVQAGDDVGVSATVRDISVKILRGNELGVRASVCFTLTPIKKAVAAIVSEIKLGEKIQPSNAAVTVHITAKGETAWQVAKSLGMTPEEVVKQNPDLSFPCNGSERIVVYRRAEREAK